MKESKQQYLLNELIDYQYIKNGKKPTVGQAVEMFNKLSLWDKFDNAMERAAKWCEDKGYL